MTSNDLIRQLNGILSHIHRGEHANAVALGKSTCNEYPSCVEAKEYLGYAFGVSGDWAASVATLQSIIADKKNDLNFLNNLANAYVNIGENESALRLLNAVEARWLEMPEMFFTAALAGFKERQWLKAIDIIQRMPKGTEADRDAALILAKCFNAVGEYQRARDVLSYIEIRWDVSFDLLLEQGTALAGLGDNGAAEKKYVEAISLLPGNDMALAALADMYEKSNRLKLLEELFEGFDPERTDNPKLLLVYASYCRRIERLEIAVSVLKRASHICDELSLGGAIQFELGRVLDEARMYDAAFAAFESGNLKTLEDFRQKFPELHARVDDLEWLVGGANSKNNCNFPHRKIAHTMRDPIFIVGFPRSGTTLLEQVLAAHPGLVCMEERACVGETQNFYQERFAGILLEDLTNAQVIELREKYFDLVEENGVSIGEGILVDKHPFNMARVGFIKCLFPDARIVFALRHPCDVVLSCFMQNFVVSDGSVGFHSLMSSAEIYDRAMSKWLRERDYACPSFMTVKYEEMVADLFGTIQSLFSYLDLPWNESVLSYLEKARAKARINTPSYHQVVRPVYQTSAFRWLNYFQHFEEVLPLLNPYIDAFGYEVSAKSR